MTAAPTVIFDCDGTLTDSHHMIVESMTLAFQQVNLPAPDDMAVRRVIGLSLPVAIAKLAPDASPDFQSALVRAYKDCFGAIRQRGHLTEMLYPGVRRCLEDLQARGVRMGIATGKSKRGLDHLLDLHDLRGFFGTLQTADGNASKPHPQMLENAMFELGAQPRHTVMVGDSPYDIQMAHAAGTYAVGVSWSDHGGQALMRAGAHGMLDDYAHWSVLLRHWDDA